MLDIVLPDWVRPAVLILWTAALIFCLVCAGVSHKDHLRSIKYLMWCKVLLLIWVPKLAIVLLSIFG